MLPQFCTLIWSGLSFSEGNNNSNANNVTITDGAIREVEERILIMILMLFSITLTTLLTPICQIPIQDAFGSSSLTFERQELILDRGNWFDLLLENSTKGGPNYIDIESVSYFSNGTHLNATLWLANFTDAPTEYENVNYGMYFDVDSNNRTGSGGVDYKVEVNWNNKSRIWTRLLEEWSSTGHNNTLDKENTTDFFEDGGSFVTLNADLGSMLSPNQYRILFYAEVIDFENRLSWIIDSTDWISIPPPDVDLTVSPSSINLIQGGNSIVDLQINSSTPDELDIHLDLPNRTDITITADAEDFRVPAFGVASAQLSISTPFWDVSPRYTITIPVTITPVYAPLNLGFGSATLPPSSSENQDDLSPSSRVSKTNNEVVSISVIFSAQTIAVHEQLFNSINQWVTPLTALYTAMSTIIGGILALMYKRRKERGKRKSKDKKNE